MTNEQLAYELLLHPESLEFDHEACFMKNATDEDLHRIYLEVQQHRMAEELAAQQQQAVTTPKTPRRMDEDEEARENSKKARID
jgi:hypothetical protein